MADIILVPAVTESGGLATFLVESRALGYTASGQLGLDHTRRVCVTAFDEAPAVLLGRGDSAATALHLAERDFLLATAWGHDAQLYDRRAWSAARRPTARSSPVQPTFDP